MNQFYKPTHADNIIVKNIIMCETSSNYNEVYQRPYELSLSHSDVGRLQNTMFDQKVNIGVKLTDERVASAVPDILKISSMPGKKVIIPNGWSTKRFMFILTVEEYIGNVTFTYYIQGFTDYFGISFRQTIDPKMLCYINSIATVKTEEDYTRPGTFNTQLIRMYNVITNLAGQVEYADVTPYDQLCLIRPMDIFDNNVVTAMSGAMGISDTFDTSTIIRPNVSNTSDRSNNNPISHLTKTLNGCISSKLLTNIGYDESSLYQEASNYSTEARISENGFIKKLYQLTGYESATTFTLETLNMINPIEPQVAINDKPVFISRDYMFVDANDTAPLNGMGVETTKAIELTNALSSVMTENFIGELTLSLSTVGRRPIIELGAPPKSFIKGLNPITEQFFLSRVMEKVERMILPMVSNNYLLEMNISIVADLLSDTVIKISWVNNQAYGTAPTVFRIPSFADSLFTPVICDSNVKAGLMQSYNVLIDTTLDVVGNTNSSRF